MSKTRTQSLAGLIRQRLDSIEARLAVGVRQEAIRAELAAEGYETTLKNLRNELCRARKRVHDAIPTISTIGTTVSAAASLSNVTSHHGPDSITEAQSVANNPQSGNPTANPLKKPAGFSYRGTQAIDIDDLV